MLAFDWSTTFAGQVSQVVALPATNVATCDTVCLSITLSYDVLQGS